MFLGKRIISSFSQMGKNYLQYQNKVWVPSFAQLPNCLFQCQKYPCSSESGKKSTVPGTMSTKFETFEESTAPVILDIVEEREKIDAEEDVIHDEFEGMNLERGVTGVFEINDLVDLLRNEKAQDICVIKVSEECCYADYIVIVTGMSSRHMLALMEFTRKVYKMKMFQKDIVPKFEGKKSKDWMALDLGNIILHTFSREGRELYDLESLWSLGKEYDTLSQTKDKSTSDLTVDYAKLLSSLTPDSPRT